MEYTELIGELKRAISNLTFSIQLILELIMQSFRPDANITE